MLPSITSFLLESSHSGGLLPSDISSHVFFSANLIEVR